MKSLKIFQEKERKNPQEKNCGQIQVLAKVIIMPGQIGNVGHISKF